MYIIYCLHAGLQSNQVSCERVLPVVDDGMAIEVDSQLDSLDALDVASFLKRNESMKLAERRVILQ